MAHPVISATWKDQAHRSQFKVPGCESFKFSGPLHDHSIFFKLPSLAFTTQRAIEGPSRLPSFYRALFSLFLALRVGLPCCMHIWNFISCALKVLSCHFPWVLYSAQDYTIHTVQKRALKSHCGVNAKPDSGQCVAI